MTTPQTPALTSGHIQAEVQNGIGFITLDRPSALNSLSLGMVRDLTTILQHWKDDPAIVAVAIRGNSKQGPFGAFCAGGDIRFLHQAGLDRHPDLDAFFTEEYELNHLTHNYPKPYIAFMDGVVMGGGMGISQGGSVRVVTDKTKMAMPETAIGLFPDVGGGYFLSRCPGATGEWLALTGQMIGAGDAVALGLADGAVPAQKLPAIWEGLQTGQFQSGADVQDYVRQHFEDMPAPSAPHRNTIDRIFSLPTVGDIITTLEQSQNEWEQQTAQTLRKRSPLMLHVVLEQIRRARQQTLAQDLRMERDMVHHCFYLRPNSETIEGIRALAVDKDNNPQWQPSRIEDVNPAEVAAFFQSPWQAQEHPLVALQ